MPKVILLFRTTVRYDYADMLHKPLDYYPVLSYPMAEMSGPRPEHWLSDFADACSSTQWLRSYRRRLMSGDVIFSGTDCYVVITAEDKEAWPSAHVVPGWPQLRFVTASDLHADLITILLTSKQEAGYI